VPIPGDRHIAAEPRADRRGGLAEEVGAKRDQLSNDLIRDVDRPGDRPDPFDHRGRKPSSAEIVRLTTERPAAVLPGRRTGRRDP